MIDTSLINSYFVIPVILGCFLVGYLVKHYTKIENRFIPLIMMVIGMAINIIYALTTPEETVTFLTVIAGGVSGLATTGVYELLENTIMRSPKDDKEDPPQQSEDAKKEEEE